MTRHRVNAANLTVEWIDRGREPQCAPDPAYPNGIDVDGTRGELRTCQRSLPHPARRCGYFLLKCTECQLSVVITTAGRSDDPRSVKVACRPNSIMGITAKVIS